MDKQIRTVSVSLSVPLLFSLFQFLSKKKVILMKCINSMSFSITGQVILEASNYLFSFYMSNISAANLIVPWAEFHILFHSAMASGSKNMK